MTNIQQEHTEDGLNLYKISVIVVFMYTAFGWLVPLGVKIGYGRLKNSLFKFDIEPKLAWFLFQVPNLLWAIYFLFYCDDQLSLGYGLFIIHYINRDIIYPLRMKTTNPVPLQIVLSAASFTFANGYVQGLGNNKIQQINQYSNILKYIGLLIFFIGMGINIKSDDILQNARSSSKKQKYVLINQFLFKYVSNPNYLGQIIQWFGYYLVCQNFQSFIFFFSTLNILVAAAIPRNKWNKQNIKGYPSDRKAVVPYVI